MKKVLDLSVFEEQTMEVKLSKEKTIRLQKPSQRMVIELMKFQSVNENDGAENIMKAVDDITLMILNTNDAGEQFSEEYITNNMNTQMKVSLIAAYGEYIVGIQSDPN